MRRNAFGQIVRSPMIRTVNDGDGGGGDGGKQFTPPDSQEALDKIINAAVGRAHKQYTGFDDFKAKAEKWDAHEQEQQKQEKPADKDKDQKPAGVSETDVDKRIQDALAAQAKELAVERVGDALDKALEGRTYPASLLFNLDRSQFVKDDGKTVDRDALTTWVNENTAEGVKQSRRIPGQGERDSNATGGSVQAGRDLFDSEKKPNRKD